jgi:hypothetical protein
MKNGLGILGALVLVAVGSYAWAESLKEKEARAKEQELIKPTVDDMNKKCGTKLMVTFDWASFKGKVADEDKGQHVATTCDILPHVIGLVCEDGDDAKAAVKKGITGIKCVGTAEKNPSTSFKAKTIILSTPLSYEKGIEARDVRELIKNNI